MFAAIAGVAAGFFHVLAGPDHLAAVAPLAVGAERTAWRSGLTWGIGHTAGVLAVGTLLLAFRELLPIDLVSAWSERLVGLALVAVGAWGIWEARRLRVHRHDTGAPHAHVTSRGRVLDAGTHGHQHASLRLHGHARAGASLGMGTLHGLAGSSHLFGILPSLAFASRADAGLYLAGFGAGAIAAMTAFAALVGAVSLASGRSHAVVRQALLLTTSGAAVLAGGVWLLA